MITSTSITDGYVGSTNSQFCVANFAQEGVHFLSTKTLNQLTRCELHSWKTR